MVGHRKIVKLRKLIRFAEAECGGPIEGYSSDVYDMLLEMSNRLHENLLEKGHTEIIDVPEDQIREHCAQFPSEV